MFLVSLLPIPVKAHEAPESTPQAWRISAAAILIAGAFLRLYDLNLVPLHHDEGVNGSFLLHLVRDGFYQYDPQNYHGPTLYYFAAVIPWISKLLFGKSLGESYGLSTFTIRFIPAAFGVATIWLVLILRPRRRTVASLAGAALLAVSPGAVYLSRYFIHETLFVFFTLGVVVAALRFYESGRSLHLLLAAALAALLFATKETAFMSAGVLLIALMGTWVFVWLRGVYAPAGRSPEGQEKELTGRAPLHIGIERFGGWSSIAVLSLAAISLFITIDILFYSSFFTNYPKGLYDALKTFQFWSQTSKLVHVYPWSMYLSWIWQEESPLLLLGAAGIVLVLWHASNRFAVFTALWALGMIAAYSLVPYKTPWLMLNFLVPLAITGGYAFEEIYSRAGAMRRSLIAFAIAGAAVGVSGYQALRLNFFHYDDKRYVYVYAHTQREFFSLLEEIDRVSKRAGTGDQTGITVTSPDYWPLPWYVRNYARVSYHGRIVPSNEPIIIGSRSQELNLDALLRDRYEMIKSDFNVYGTYPLRPGVELVLFVRRDLATR